MKYIHLSSIALCLSLTSCNQLPNIGVPEQVSNFFSEMNPWSSDKELPDPGCLNLVRKPQWFEDNFTSIKAIDRQAAFKSFSSKEDSLDAMKTHVKNNTNFIPWELEKKIGEYIRESQQEVGGLILSKNANNFNKRLYERAEQILLKTTKSLPKEILDYYDFKILVIDNGKAQFNAHAIPGGVILVTSHALTSPSSDALEILIAHEISHVFKRHTTRKFQATVVDSIETVEALEELFSDKAEEKIFAIVDDLFKNGEALLTYPADLEDEADLCGISHLYQLPNTNTRKAANDFIQQLSKTTEEKNESKYPWTVHLYRDLEDRNSYLLESREIVAAAIKARKEADSEPQ